MFDTAQKAGGSTRPEGAKVGIARTASDFARAQAVGVARPGLKLTTKVRTPRREAVDSRQLLRGRLFTQHPNGSDTRANDGRDLHGNSSLYQLRL
jgi:hypothetical protein